MTKEDFLLNLNREFSKYTEYISNKDAKTVIEKRINAIKLSNAAMLYEIIQFYFRDQGITTPVGPVQVAISTNIMTEDEIQVIIDKLNNIMNTYLYVTF